MTKREREKQNALTKISWEILLKMIEVNMLMIKYKSIRATPAKEIKGELKLLFKTGPNFKLGLDKKPPKSQFKHIL